MKSTADSARALLHEVATPLGVDHREVSPAAEPGEENALAELTGYPDGPPLRVPSGPAEAARVALGVVAAYSEADVAGLGVLSERARLSGLTRNAPFSPGGAFRMLPARDGWFGLSLSRPSDLDLIPALTGSTSAGDRWDLVGAWLRGMRCSHADTGIRLLGLPGAPIPPTPLPERRPPVVVERGGPRHHTESPLVVDLTSLWAGPLCARLLGLGGAQVTKIESVARPDGARRGSAAFYELLHTGHNSVVIDFDTQRDRLQDLISAADVVLEASRPRALRQLGIEASAHVKRGTIWVSITAYGRGPLDAQRVGFGDDVAAGAGLVLWTNDGPIPIGDAIADPLAGVHAAAATTIALQSDHGALLDVSMHDVARRANGYSAAGSIESASSP